MNPSSLIGFGIGSTIIYFALQGTSTNYDTFLDYHSFLIVCGGTAAAASISFPIGDVLNLTKVFFRRMLWKKPDYQSLISNFLDLNKRAAASHASLNEALSGIKNPFMREAVGLVAQGVLTEREIRETLEQRLKTVEDRYMSEANMFRIIGRFPPAFGLLATTLGMIGLLQKIGSPDSQKLIGPAMSIGLVGTLYGIALANLVFLPMAENLTIMTQEEITLRRLIVEGTMMLKSHTNPLSMREGLNSFLLPRERVTRNLQRAA